MKPIRFRNDKRLRDKLFTPENYLHPAKGHLGLWQAIIEKYTAPGDTILDPMAGVGATLTAALMGRNVVCVELEPHWVTPMKASWEKMRQHPMLGHELGQVLILRGDARALPIASADHIITSPPYEGSANEKQHNDSGIVARDPSFGHFRYSSPIDTIISSPPYEGSVSDNKEGPGQTSVPGGWKADTVNKHGGYTRPSAIITSPPYAGGLTPKDSEKEKARYVTFTGRLPTRAGQYARGYTRPTRYTPGTHDILGVCYMCAQSVDGRENYQEHAADVLPATAVPLPTGVPLTPKRSKRRSNAGMQRDSSENLATKPTENASIDSATSTPNLQLIDVESTGSMRVMLPQYNSKPSQIETNINVSIAGLPWKPTVPLSNQEALTTWSVVSEEDGTRQIISLCAAHAAIATKLGAMSHVPQGGDNVGNLRGSQYWQAMSKIYQECHRVLRPGGIMALVLKGFTRNGVYQDLPTQTADLVESLGFVKVDEWQRELWSLSFWRILQSTDKEETVVAHRQGLFDLDIQEVKQMKRVGNGKLDERLRFEHVLAFRKDG